MSEQSSRRSGLPALYLRPHLASLRITATALPTPFELADSATLCSLTFHLKFRLSVREGNVESVRDAAAVNAGHATADSPTHDTGAQRRSSCDRRDGGCGTMAAHTRMRHAAAKYALGHSSQLRTMKTYATSNVHCCSTAVGIAPRSVGCLCTCGRHARKPLPVMWAGSRRPLPVTASLFPIGLYR